MNKNTLTNCISLYRGYADEGIGEGPECPIATGWQYLGAVKNNQTLDYAQLAEEGLDNQAFAEIKAWMGLSLSSNLYTDLGDKFETWSYYTHPNFILIARSVPAGKYERRPTCFTHARIWKNNANVQSQLPVLLLGRSEFFDEPWRQYDANKQDTCSDLLPLQISENTIDDIREQQDKAVALLSYLLQTLENQQSLIILVPETDFCQGSSLYELIACVQALLPPLPSYTCKTRIHANTEQLEDFLGENSVNLLVLPNKGELISKALQKQSNAVVFNIENNECIYPPNYKLNSNIQDYSKILLTIFLKNDLLRKVEYLNLFKVDLISKLDIETHKKISVLKRNENWNKIFETSQLLTEIKLGLECYPEDIINNYLLSQTQAPPIIELVIKEIDNRWDVTDKYKHVQQSLTQKGWDKILESWSANKIPSADEIHILKQVLNLLEKDLISQDFAVELFATVPLEHLPCNEIELITPLIKAELLFKSNLKQLDTEKFGHQWESVDIRNFLKQESIQKLDAIDWDKVWNALIQNTINDQFKPNWIEFYFKDITDDSVNKNIELANTFKLIFSNNKVGY